MIREAIPAKPKVGSAESLARRVAQRVDQGNYREGLDIGRKFPPDTQKRVARIEQFGTERDSSGAKDRKGAEKTRFENANKAAVLVEKFMEVGYDKMGADQDALRDAVLDVVKLRPSLAAELKSIKDPKKIDAFAERILRDPKLLAEVRKKYDILTDPDNNELLVDAASPLQKEVDKLNLDLNDKIAEIADVDNQIATVNAKLKDYDRPVGGIGPLGPKAQELKDLTDGEKGVTGEIAIHKAQFDDADMRYKELITELAETRAGRGKRSVAEVETAMEKVRGELTDSQKEIRTRQDLIQRRKDLELEEQRFNQEKQGLDQQKREKTTEMKKIDVDLTERQGLLSDAKRIRTTQEQDITSGFQNIVKEAANEVFNQEAGSYYQATEEELQEAAEKATPDESALFQGMQQAWRKEITTGKWFWQTKRMVADGAKVGRDFSRIMGKGGPAEVMTNILKTMDNPGTGAKYTGEDIQKLLSNEEFVGKMQPMLVRTLLRHRIHTGGLTHEDIDIIVDAPWGEGMIQAALNRNAEFRQAVAGVYGEGALKGHGPIDKLKAEFKKHPASFIALLLGLGIPGLLIGGAAGALTLGSIAGFLGPTGALLGGAGGAGAGAAVAGGSRLGGSPESETPIAA